MKIDLGKLDPKGIENLHRKATYFIYPTCFPEIDCISFTKAVQFQNVVLTTAVGALKDKRSFCCNDLFETKCHDNVSKVDYSLTGESLVAFGEYVMEGIHTHRSQKKEMLHHSLLSSSETVNEAFAWSRIRNLLIESLKNIEA